MSLLDESLLVKPTHRRVTCTESSNRPEAIKRTDLNISGVLYIHVHVHVHYYMQGFDSGNANKAVQSAMAMVVTSSAQQRRTEGIDDCQYGYIYIYCISVSSYI